jgi:signal transduction histidine kinase
MEVPGKMPDERSLDELRRSILTISGGAWPRPGRLYLLAPPDRLVFFDATRLPSTSDAREALAPGAEMQFSPSDEVIPLELDGRTLWGYWVVGREYAADALERIPELQRLLCRLHDVERIVTLDKRRRALLEVLDLGEALESAVEASHMLPALHRAAQHVLGAQTTYLALFGLDGSLCYRAEGDHPPESVPASSKAWLEAFPNATASWTQGDSLSEAAATIMDRKPVSGLASRLGDPVRPSGILAVTRPESAFHSADGHLLKRMADFALVNLLRIERGGQGQSRSLQIPDLFVLLSQEKERLDYIMRSVPVGLLLTNAEGVIELANQAVGEALGLTDVELREKKMFGSRQAGRTVRGLIQKSQAESKPVTTPYEMEGRWFQIQVIPWPGGGHFLVVTQDIHDWFQLNRLKEDLISIISHEVKNPLTAVLNAAHLLASGRAGPMNEAQSRVAVLVQENSEQIKNLLDDVVRLSRIYHLNVRQEPVALVPMVRAVHDRSAATIKGKLITWTETLEDLTVNGDASMLESLLVNLIGNAIKYTGIGGHIGVKLWSDGAWAKLRVVDDGPGIPADEKERLFSPFFRASNVRDQVAGTGLGLVISRNIAERLGGSLTAVSPVQAEDASLLGRVRPSTRGAAFQVELLLAR